MYKNQICLKWFLFKRLDLISNIVFNFLYIYKRLRVTVILLELSKYLMLLVHYIEVMVKCRVEILVKFCYYHILEIFLEYY